MQLVTGASLGDNLEKVLDEIVTFLPKIIAFLVILLIGYILARIIKAAITKVLQGAGIDKALHSGQSGSYVEKIAPGASPAKLIGSVVYYLILLAALAIAIPALGISSLNNFIEAIVAYLPNVIVAILIFVLAGAIATAVGGLVAKTMGDTPTGKVVGSVVPVLVMGIATFMILDQLKIAEDIVRITYQALMFSLARGLALAFGLGGRELAAQALQSATDKGKEQKDQVKQDFQLGKERGQEQAQQAKDKAQEKVDSGGSESSTQVQSSNPPRPQY